MTLRVVSPGLGDLVSAGELARRWGVTERTLRNWRELQGLPCVVLSRRADGSPARIGFPVTECAAWLDGRQGLAA